MDESSVASNNRISKDEAISRVAAWWNEGRRTTRRWDIVGGRHTVEVLQELHRQTPRSLLIDATGRTAEEIVTEVLDFNGVPKSAQVRTSWSHLRKYFAAETLILVYNVHRAGRTRHSARPVQVQNQLAERLSYQRKVGVVVAAPPQNDPPARELVMHLQGVAHSVSDSELSRVPPQIWALALAELRSVPLRVWRELVHSSGLPDTDEVTLEATAVQFPHLITLDSGCVRFIDETLAEALRRATDRELTLRVNRHMVEWLREIAPQLGHARGWAASGEVGRYAANGLAMHAVQAGSFEELLGDGGVIAHITQEALLDAAHCAFEGSIPGNNPAADTVHLWSYGVAPSTQPEWAAWLHLMATAREDEALAAGITGSGIRLPWTTKWSHWRPPGGYHPRYLKPGVVNDLYGVYWHGRPAVAVECESPPRIHVRDVATGELLGGPWHEEDLPEAAQQAITWADSAAHGTRGPTTLGDFEDADGADEGPDEEILYLALNLEDRVVVAGIGGLFVVEPDEPDFPGIEPPRGMPLSGCPTVAGSARPFHASDPALTDLAELLEEPTVVRTAVDALPSDLSDTAARRTLSEFGIPVIDARGISLEPDLSTFLSEVAWEEGLESPSSSGPFFKIGRWMGGHVLIDGPTGHILRMPSSCDEDGLEGTLVAESLEDFLTKVAHWITGRQILDLTENDVEAHLLRQDIEESLWNIGWRGSTAGAWLYPLHND
ncbi:hypothetical protein FCH28_10435 [Streptomyces piniterrae]|uniref:SUKH-4 immunity protein of toxin-antitoxin system n=1 Tax=Streptomyces piniterrae TaxID=2571125 RepID=A0A4U0NN67_9ACTN|nr:SUKH-4 family immunity protein [Streptomyces piniterrae]TJZ55723.1 hypothetical protein FCH28_10435 [Streptomyces piniterrae]